MSVTPPVKVRIIRRGNGQVQVNPPIVQLTAGEGFSMLNTTNESAEVEFDREAVLPRQHTIPARSTAAFTAGAGPDYVEYDVELATGHRAEGNSRPGAIIDP